MNAKTSNDVQKSESEIDDKNLQERNNKDQRAYRHLKHSEKNSGERP